MNRGNSWRWRYVEVGDKNNANWMNLWCTGVPVWEVCLRTKLLLWFKKSLGETQTLFAGCSKAEAKIFAPSMGRGLERRLFSYMQQHNTAHCNNGSQTGSHYEIPVARLSFGKSVKSFCTNRTVPIIFKLVVGRVYFKRGVQPKCGVQNEKCGVQNSI